MKLLYTARGPRAPLEGEPQVPVGALKHCGHIKYGSRAPYDKYEVFKDDAGVFWAEKKTVPAMLDDEDVSDSERQQTG